jgi:predicted N-acetyltransferase YhbS
MKTTNRHYDHDTDYEGVGRFLVRTYSTTGNHINWLQPRWEYMHYHPLVRNVDLASIGVWEADGEIVGVVHPEHHMGVVYFEIHPAHAHLKRDMLAYAEEHLCVPKDGGRSIRVYINDNDAEFQAVAVGLGYGRHGGSEEMSLLAIPEPFPAIPLREGFKLKSLAEDNDLRKIHRVLWRGFGHGDVPPEDEIEDRRFVQSAPNFRHDLTVVVEAPDGNFAAYCGMWYEPVHRIAYVEPVATDPDYRRMGLGRAAVLEGIRRCGEEGATVAYVGSVLPIYIALGFRQIYNCSVWQRELS